MKAISRASYSIIIPFLLLFSCTEEDSEESFKPRYTGANGEVVIVCSDKLWNGPIGDTVEAILSQDLHGVPRPEPHFDVGRVNTNSMTSLIQKHRNLFFIELNEDLEHAAKIELGEDQWSKGQLFFRLTGNDPDSILHHFLNNKARIIERFDKAERERLMDGYASSYSKGIDKELRKDHGISMKVPMGCEIKKEAEDFVWIERFRQREKGGRNHDVNQGLFIYYYPYESEAQFDKDSLLKVRDSVLQEHVPGPSEGSYMTTEDRFPSVAPKIEEFEFQGDYAAQLRGLWRIENDQMGGPFISLSTVDEKRGRLVTVEGFVFAPKFEKREYLRQLQAMIYSLDFVEEEGS